jgi:mercuric reductase
MSERTCDLLILGSGSTAFAAALHARELGKTAVMTEERTVGGTCVNRGCLPSKNLIDAARLLHEARRPRHPGLVPRGMDVDFLVVVEQKDALVGAYRRRKYESLTGDGFRVVRGHAEFIDAHTAEVGNERWSGRSILIATGSRPVLPTIDGLDAVPFLTSDLLGSDEPVELIELPASLVIVGGGYIALELGQMFARLGSRVTLLERSTRLLPHGYEPEVGPAIQAILQAEGVRIVTDAQPLHVARAGDEVRVTARLDGHERCYQGQRLLVATGRRPNTDAIRVERSGVRLDGRGAVRVDRHLRTNVGHIFAAGDAIGGQTNSQMATPVASHDGVIAAHNALADAPPRAVEHRVIPRVIFTDPPVATVGLTEAQALAAGWRCWCNTLPMELVPRAAAIRDTRGLIKMVADADTHEVLGVSMIGHEAGEVIHEAAMALRFRARVHDFVDLLHVFPTMAEALKLVAISRFKDPSRLSCCAE